MMTIEVFYADLFQRISDDIKGVLTNEGNFKAKHYRLAQIALDAVAEATTYQSATSLISFENELERLCSSSHDDGMPDAFRQHINDILDNQ